jgi:dTDP-4-dehydrorhamnose 3,5-epimerase
MIFNKTKLSGVCVIEPEKLEDERGFFTTLWSDEIFKEYNLDTKLTESNISFNKKTGTLRGLHYQIPPYGGAKLVRCTRGKTFDVILDLRPTSQTFKQWIATELTPDNYKSNYIPSGCAHGFQTLEPNTEVHYLMSQTYSSKHTRTVRWNDNAFQINWPFTPTVISQKDSLCPDFTL